MNNIINLVRLSWNDFISVKKMTLFIIISFSVAAFVSAQFLLMLIGLVTYTIAYQTIAYEEMHKINYLVAYLPITKKEYVVSRYLFSIMSIFIGCILFSVVFVVSKRFNMQSVLGVNYKISLYIGIIGAITLISILNPVIFYFGIEKGRLAVMLIFMLLILIPSIIQDNIIVGDIIKRIATFNNDLLAIMYVLLIVFISFFVSKYLYEKREVID